MMITRRCSSNNNTNTSRLHPPTLPPSPPEFKQLQQLMFRTYAATPQFESMDALDEFDRDRVCYIGPDALDGSAVLYLCLARLKPDHFRIVNCILVRVYLLCAAVSKRPFNIVVDCSNVQASTPAVIDVIKDLATTLLAAFALDAKKNVRRVFLVHPSVNALADIQMFVAQAAPRLKDKVRLPVFPAHLLRRRV